VLHEFAIGWPDPATGLRYARNPWDLARSPGGSSSGTGAAIAAGLILGGLGTDTGGSIRGPAAYCGISGLKPTFGRVSNEGCVPLSYSLDHIGPMARTMRDCAVLLQVLAGFDPLDPCTARVAVPDYAADLDGSVRGLRIGLVREHFFDVPELDGEVRQAVLDGVDRLAAAGASVVDVALPHAAIARTAQRAIMLGEAYAYHLPDLQSRPQLYGKYTRQQITQGALYSAADYVQAQRVRSVIKAEALAALSVADVLVTPTMLNVAPRFEGYDPDALRRAPTFMAIWNLTGLPAASVCCGFSNAGLPIGMQIVGKPFDEAMVLRVGDAYQQLTDWHTRRATEGLVQ
jgi:aspartyl-tRNA(Asn)/glutamyl-tRNA(Gln) amidotransferase subunit A